MKRLLLVLSVLSSTSIFAVNEYYSLTKSVRALGMGGAFYGLSDDQHALFYNPAGLSLIRKESEWLFSLRGEVAGNSISGIQKLASGSDKTLEGLVNSLQEFQGKPIYGGVGVLPFLVKKNFAMGMLIADTKVQVAVLGRDLDTVFDVTAISDSGLFVGYGREAFLDGLHLGLTVKAVVRGGGRRLFEATEIAQGNSIDLSPARLGGVGAGIDADFGAIYEVPVPIGLEHHASLTFNNILASDLSMLRFEGTPPRLQRTVSLGWHSTFEGWEFIDNFHVLVDFAEFGLGGEDSADFGARKGSFFKHMNLGVEMPIQGWFVLRGGFYQGNFTAGLGIRTRFFNLDLATYEPELNQTISTLSSRRFALSMSFGFGSTPPLPVEPKIAKVTPKTTAPSAEDMSLDAAPAPAVPATPPAPEAPAPAAPATESGAQ